MTQPAPPLFDLAVELARIDWQRAELLLLDDRVNWTASIDLPTELARIDAARARPAQLLDVPDAGLGSWSDRHVVGVAAVSYLMGAILAIGGGMAVAWWFPGFAAGVDPGLAAVEFGVFLLLLVRR